MPFDERPLRIGINARLISGRGGIEQVVIGLAAGLSKLGDGDEEYLFLTFRDHEEWIGPHIHGPCRILHGPALPRTVRWKTRIGTALPTLRTAWSKLYKISPFHLPSLPRSDGTIERAGVEVMHFSFPMAFVTSVSTIYNPCDLQHLYFPQFFSPKERKQRETTYRAFCQQAQMVHVQSTSAKNDLIAHYGLPQEKIWIIPSGSVLEAYPNPRLEDLKAAQAKFNLPETFVFYPAQTWPHKNHVGLLEALVILRREGLRIPLVSSGHRYDFYKEIAHRARELGLAEQVQFLDFVTPLELQCLYRLCRCMVFPSRCEGFGLPLVEAFSAGVPRHAPTSHLCRRWRGTPLFSLTPRTRLRWQTRFGDSGMRKD